MKSQIKEKKKTTHEEWSFLGVLNIKKKGKVEKKSVVESTNLL